MDLQDFSYVNLQRCNTWHKLSDWSLDQWATAVTGEWGETCNKIKKLNRLRGGIQQNAVLSTEAELRAQIGEEIADTFTYLDLLAQRAGLDLQTIVIDKFNKVSKREGLPQRID